MRTVVLRATKWVVALTLIAACGKNDGFVTTGQLPVYQNNPNQQYFPQNPSNTFNPNGGCQSGCSNYTGNSPYYMWYPLVYYFQQNYQQQQYWNQLWQNWQSYAYYYGYQQNDFNGFWFDYCPQQMQGTQYWGLYNYFDQGVYYWTSPSSDYSYSADSSYFWQYYSGFPYYDVNQYSYCAYSSCF